MFVGTLSVQGIEGIWRQCERLGKSPEQGTGHAGHLPTPARQHGLQCRQRLRPLIRPLQPPPGRVARRARQGRAIGTDIKLLSPVGLTRVSSAPVGCSHENGESGSWRPAAWPPEAAQRRPATAAAPPVVARDRCRGRSGRKIPSLSRHRATMPENRPGVGRGIQLPQVEDGQVNQGAHGDNAPCRWKVRVNLSF